MNKPILFNLTIKLSKEDSSDWLKLVTNEILPACTDGTIIQSTQVNRVMMGEDDGDETFAIQFVYASEKIFKEYKLSTMRVFLERVDESYRGKYVYFATMMEILHRHNRLN